MRAPASIVAVPLLGGTAAAILLFERLPDLFAFCAAAAALLAWLAALACFAAGGPAECVIAIVLGAAFAGLSLGASSADAAYGAPLLRWFTSRPPASGDHPIILEGTCRDDAAVTASGVSMTVDVDRVQSWPGLRRDPSQAFLPRRGGVRLSVAGALATGRFNEWRAGRRVRAAAILRLPTVYRDPGVVDDQRSLARRGIVLVGSVKSGALVGVIGRGSFLSEAAGSARGWVRARLRSLVGRWSRRSGAVAAAIVVGDRTGLSADDERRLQEAGTYHVIAISGGNIAILTGILLTLLRALRIPRRSGAAVVIVALLFYGQVTGAAASVGRAIAAAVIYLTGRLLDHRGPPMNALAVAAVCAVASSPLSALDAGFLLSFGATLGILALAPRFAAAAAPVTSGRVGAASTGASLDKRSRVALVTAANVLLIATICAEIVLAPLGALLFLRLTFAGLLLNFAAIPLMTVVQVGSLVALAADYVAPAAAASFGYLTHLAAVGLIESARMVEIAPWLSVRVAAPAIWLMVLYYSACIGALLMRRYARLFAAAAGGGLALMIASPPFAAHEEVPASPRGMVRVVILDVGQGDASLVWLPGGRSLLIDAGGLWSSQTAATSAAAPVDAPSNAFDIGERVVAPAVRTIGVRRLDTLVLTHGDADHIGGAATVMGWLRPRMVWEGVPVPPFEPLRALAAAASARGMTWRNVQAGDVEREGGVEIRVLHPPPPEWERQRVRNEDSIVLDVRVGEVSVILPGDVGAEGERALLIRADPPRTVILKVPHHGSATSSTPELLAALHPAAAIVSAGRDNRFGHPAPVVLARYRAAGIPIYRTDQDGAVFIDTDGKTVWIRGWTGRSMVIRR
jgi:competence protein ComEC